MSAALVAGTILRVIGFVDAAMIPVGVRSSVQRRRRP